SPSPPPPFVPPGPAVFHGPRSARILALAVACGLCVANLYYIQPILPSMAAALHRTPQSLTPAVSCTQLGYALGLFALVPLGDALDRRRLLTVLLTATAAVLALIPLASGAWLFGLFFLLGLVTVSAMVIVPQAADMAHPEQRGQVVGTVMTGLILGTLLCRTLAGSLTQLLDWRAVYWLAAVFMVGTCLLVRAVLPGRPPAAPDTADMADTAAAPNTANAANTPHTPAATSTGSTAAALRDYARLLASLGPLVRGNPLLVRRSLLGALGFAAFNLLWTALPLRLTQSPYHFGASAIGALGLVGAAGALGASLAGRLADRGRQTAVTLGAFALIAVSFAVSSGSSGTLLVLVTAILLIDFAVQGAHITNQATVFGAAGAGERSRITTVYMTAYFLGGAAGSAAAGAVWPHGGWPAVARTGVLTAAAALLLSGVLALRESARTRTRTLPTSPKDMP
uniref:MFS transporter n=1 Tax=Actinacidiphila sp. bgisy145 TaxID=3413792 RepID=UPI003EBE4678